MNASAILSGFVGGCVVVLFSLVVVLVQRWWLGSLEEEPPTIARCMKCQREQSYGPAFDPSSVGWRPDYEPGKDVTWLCPFCVRELNTRTCAGGCGATKVIGESVEVGWGLDKHGLSWCPTCGPKKIAADIEALYPSQPPPV